MKVEDAVTCLARLQEFLIEEAVSVRLTEAAKAIGISEPSVKTLLHRMRLSAYSNSCTM